MIFETVSRSVDDGLCVAESAGVGGGERGGDGFGGLLEAVSVALGVGHGTR